METVYGIFRNADNRFYILAGEIIEVVVKETTLVTVQFRNGYKDVYSLDDFGKRVFRSEDEAEAAVEELYQRAKYF